MTYTTAQLLDLEVGVRSDYFEYELLDLNRNKVGLLDVETTSAPRLRFDTSRTVARTLTGVTITADAAMTAELDDVVRRHRVRPVLVLQNGDRHEWGVLMFGTDNRKPRSGFSTWTPDLFDESFICQQPLISSVNVHEGASVLTAFIAIVQSLKIVDFDVSSVADAPAATSLVYTAGTAATEALNALAGILACYPPYFDNHGTYRLKPAPGQGTAPDHIYEMDGGHLIDDTATITNDGYRAYNRYQVVSGSGSGAVVGTYTLPPQAPNSFEAIGFYITHTETVQGIPTVALANLHAYVNALTDRDSYIKAQWESTLDPRHDGFDLCQLLGNRYQESSWEVECKAGGRMTHSGVGVY